MEVAGAAPASGGQGGAPAAAAPTINNSPAGSPPSAAPEWTASFNDELKGYVQTKGFKDPASVVDSYRNFEKLMGAPKERILRLPEKEDASPEWDEISTKLGWPREAKDYGFETPKEGGDPAFTDAMAKIFHEARVPRRQAQAIVSKYSEFMTAQKAQIEAQQDQQRGVQTGELKKEWGAAFDQNVMVGKRAVQAFGFDGATIDKLESALGWSGVMKMMHAIGSKVGEHNFVSGSQNSGSFGGVMTPSQAKSRIAALRGDPEFTRRYEQGGVSQREEFDKLHQMAYPDNG